MYYNKVVITEVNALIDKHGLELRHVTMEDDAVSVLFRLIEHLYEQSKTGERDV